MNTTTASTTNFLELGEIVQHDGYTIQDAGTIKLGRTTYKVEIQKMDSDGEDITWLKGPRGAAYMLQPLRMFDNNGIFRIQSFGSGSFLRVQGNEVRVVMLGNAIEVL